MIDAETERWKALSPEEQTAEQRRVDEAERRSYYAFPPTLPPRRFRS